MQYCRQPRSWSSAYRIARPGMSAGYQRLIGGTRDRIRSSLYLKSSKSSECEVRIISEGHHKGHRYFQRLAYIKSLSFAR